VKPLLTHDATAEALFYGSVVALGAVEFALRRRSRARGRNSLEWTYFFILLILAASIAGGAYATKHALAPLPGSAWWPVIAGVALMWLGISFRLWAIVTLGRFFQVTVIVQEDHTVVERGPYRRLRHPSYLGAIVAMAGVGLAEGTWVSLAAMSVGAAIAFVVRIRVEERVLLSELGDAYAGYASRTARLVPGLY
jgi:protein-S-isoprenylcysteine O-methyltransferase Ste14